MFYNQLILHAHCGRTRKQLLLNKIGQMNNDVIAAKIKLLSQRFSKEASIDACSEMLFFNLSLLTNRLNCMLAAAEIYTLPPLY
jgi:hypothetical protein